MAEAAAQRSAVQQFDGFGVVQFIAAVHVFIHHLWQQTKYLHHYIYRGWGPSWVACFFVLSGFKLTYSQLMKKDPAKLEPFVPYMWRRLLRLYPQYYLSLFLTFLLSVYRGDNYPLWTVLPFNLTLTFTWIGSTAGGWHAGWHGAHWYMGDLIFHQICWRFICPWVARLSRRASFFLLIASVSVTFLRCVCIQWKASRFCERETTYWAPYTFNQFLCGMCLARLYVSKPPLQAPCPRDRLALLVGETRIPLSGLGSFVLLLLCFRVHPGKVHLLLHNAVWTGVLLPLHVLMVWCLCLEDGPMDWLCRRRPFCWLGELSYGVYIFHWNALMITQKYDKQLLPMHWSEEVRFFGIILPATCLFAVFVMVFFDRPIQAWGLRFLRRSHSTQKDHAKMS